MVTCENCQTSNSLDSRYCRSCGGQVSEEALAAALIEHARLVQEGQKLVLDGRVDEAMAVAEAAVAAHPGSREALSLKASVHEQRGEIGDAIACYERVVELFPDSAIDKIKLSHLRNAVTLAEADAVEEERRKRRTAILTGVAATVMVMALGFAIGMATQDRSAPGEPRLVTQADDSTYAGMTFGMDATSGLGVPSADAPVPGGSPRPDDEPAVTEIQANTPRPSAALPPPTPGPIIIPTGNTLPSPTGMIPGGANSELVAPIRINVEPVNPASAGPREPRSSTDPPPNMPRDPIATAPPTRERDDPGIIDIRISSGSPPPNPGGTGATTSRSRAEALLQAAQSEHQQGNYARAAQNYERAIEAGADPGRTHQQLASAYANLNRKNEAIAAHEKAIAAFEAQLAAGGNAAALNRAIEASRQAIRVLRG